MTDEMKAMDRVWFLVLPPLLATGMVLFKSNLMMGNGVPLAGSDLYLAIGIVSAFYYVYMVLEKWLLANGFMPPTKPFKSALDRGAEFPPIPRDGFFAQSMIFMPVLLIVAPFLIVPEMVSDFRPLFALSMLGVLVITLLMMTAILYRRRKNIRAEMVRFYEEYGLEKGPWA